MLYDVENKLKLLEQFKEYFAVVEEFYLQNVLDPNYTENIAFRELFYDNVEIRSLRVYFLSEAITKFYYFHNCDHQQYNYRDLLGMYFIGIISIFIPTAEKDKFLLDVKDKFVELIVELTKDIK